MRRRRNDGRCSRCGGGRDREKQRYCRACHAAYMRDHRPRHSELGLEARKRANARAYANTYQRRGHLRPSPCVACGAADAEKHHPDYGKPLEVVWLCRRCHMAEHGQHDVLYKSSNN